MRRLVTLIFGSTLFCSMCALQAALVPAYAEVGINTEMLGFEGWKLGNQGLPSDACNYMYVMTGSKNLLYYGTSTNCKKRAAQHENAVLGYRVPINAYDNALVQNHLSAADHNRITASVYNSLNHDNDETVFGDSCLALESMKTKWDVYYLDLSKAKLTALAVEKNVLTYFKGICNKVGTGTTTMSWNNVRESLRKSGASIRAPSGH